MSKMKKIFGTVNEDQLAYIYRIENGNGVTIEISDFGATILSIRTPDRNGVIKDVCLGYDSLERYMQDGPYFGAIVGRVANRIKNSSFKIDGKTYFVTPNNGLNQLHGGKKGFDKKIWTVCKQGNNSLELEYISPDLEEGYPGELKVKVTYTLTEENEIIIDYEAITNKDTIINLTNHAYFNLAGHSSGDVLDHKLMIFADYFTANGPDSIPTGDIRSVVDTPMDFRDFKKIGHSIFKEYDQLKYGNGYDINYIINEQQGLKLAAKVIEDSCGRCLEVYTTMPGIQLYSGNYLDEAGIGKGGVKYEKRSGLCLETQFYPNAIQCQNFPSPILRSGEEFNSRTIYKFLIH